MRQHRRARPGSLPPSAAQQCGAQLRWFREQAGLTREALATKAGYGPEAIKKYEYGERIPPPAAVNALADALALEAEQRAALHAAAWLAREAAPDEARLPRVVWPPLVGRTAELAVLGRHVLGEGAPVLLFAGEPGIGKTRLLDEAERLANERGWRVLRGGCTRRSAQDPYAPFVAAFLRFLADRSPAQQRQDIQGCAWLVRLLPELAETTLVPAPTWTLPPEQERRLMFASVARVLANVASPVGTLLVLDDLQWAGPDALDLVAFLLRESDAQRLRIVGAYRDTDVGPADPLPLLLADLARDGLASRVPLLPLAATEAEELLAHLVEATGSAGKNAWNAELSEQMVRQTGGVPYFLLSCAQSLQGDSLAAGRAPAIPWNVTESIRQRVAQLPQTAQQLLRLAAVAGREVAAALLLDLTARWGWQKEELFTALEAACQARLLLEAYGGPGAPEYHFAHDLIREVVIGDLSGARRADLHLQVAEALERLPESGRARRTAELAWHFLRAAEPARALPYTVQAGDQAAAVYAHAEAEKHYRTAIELAQELGDQAREAEALEKLGVVMHLFGHGQDARSRYEQALERYKSLGDRAGELRTWAWLLDVQEPSAGVQRWLEQPQALADSVVEDESGPAVLRGLAALYNSLAQQYGWLPREQLAASLRAEQIARRLGDDALLVQALLLHAQAGWCLGEDVLQSLLDLLPLAEHVGDLRVFGHTLAHIGLIYLYDHADLPRAKAYLEQALDAAERRGGPYMVIRALTDLAEYYYLAGEWGLGRECVERAATMMRQLDRPIWYDLVFAQGKLALAQGRDEDAERHLEQGLALTERWDDVMGRRVGQWQLAERDLVRGDAASAYARLEPPLAPHDERGWRVEMLQPLLAWAELALDRDEQVAARLAACRSHCGRLWLVDALRVEAMLRMKQARWQEAFDALEESLALCRAMPYPYAEAKALYVYGQFHAAKGEPDLARARYQQAIAICERLGEGLYRPHIERALADLERRTSPPRGPGASQGWGT